MIIKNDKFKIQNKKSVIKIIKAKYLKNSIELKP